MDVYKLKPTDSYEEEGIKIQQFCADCDADLQLDQALTALGLVGQVRTLGEQNEQAIQIINADIDYYKQWVLRKGGSSDEGGEDEEPETDGG
ncbi:MAG: hypothetical protein IJV17_03835, partial [Prevotella sp.]|nr:hypothetical protein [Prevotella sp.]